MTVTVPLKYLAVINRAVLDEGTAPDYQFKYVDIGSVASDGSVTVPDEALEFSAAPSRARRIAPPGATAISTVRTYLRAIAHVPDSDDALVFSTGFAIAEPLDEVDQRYLYYACRSDPFVDEVVARSVGVSYPAINPSDLACIPVPVRELSEQRRIADFLDDQVARIDNIIAAREQQCISAESLRWTEFTSRLEALRAAPVPLRRVVSVIADGPFGSAFSSSDYVNGGPAVIRLGNIGFAEFKGDDLARVPNEIYQRFPRCHVQPGDLLIASLGDARNHAGRACVAPATLGSAMVKGKCFRAQLLPHLADPSFVATLLSSSLGVEAVVQLGRGATRMMINIDVFLSAAFPLPDLVTQLEITNRFERDTAAVQSLLASLDRSIALYGELKRSLISAAVTGEFDVSSADGSRVLA